MALLVRQARSLLSQEEGSYLGLCPDPTNQLRRFPDSDPLDELEALPLDMIKIVHFTQSRDGKPYRSVDTGDIDCGAMLRGLENKGYVGAAIMEIPSDPDVFDNLSESFDFLHRASTE